MTKTTLFLSFFFFKKTSSWSHHHYSTSKCNIHIHTHTQNWFSLPTNNSVKRQCASHNTFQPKLQAAFVLMSGKQFFSENNKNKRMKSYCHWPHWSKVSSEANKYFMAFNIDRSSISELVKLFILVINSKLSFKQTVQPKTTLLRGKIAEKDHDYFVKLISPEVWVLTTLFQDKLIKYNIWKNES